MPRQWECCLSQILFISAITTEIDAPDHCPSMIGRLASVGTDIARTLELCNCFDSNGPRFQLKAASASAILLLGDLLGFLDVKRDTGANYDTPMTLSQLASRSPFQCVNPVLATLSKHPINEAETSWSLISCLVP
jgi:hypothetical protein